MYTAIKRILAGIVTAIVTALLGACDPAPGPQQLTLAHGLDVGHPVHAAMVHLGERLRELSGGSMTLRIYPSQQLGAERELVELLQIGSLDITKVSASPLESFSPAMGVFSVPYVFRDSDHFWRVAQSALGRELLQSLQSVRLRGLAYYDAGSRSFYTSGTAIHSPDDLAGLKIRVQQSPTSVAMIESLGAAATPIDWGELYTALQQGVVDGAENNPPSFHLSRHYEASAYLTLDEHTFVPDVLLVSTGTWERLSPRQREWLDAAAEDSARYQRRLWQQATAEALAVVEAAGVTVIRPDKAPFRAAVQPMHRAYGNTEIGRLIRQIKDMP